MAGVVGKSGRKSDKAWRDALRRALARHGGAEGVDGGLNAVADAVVALAAQGDLAAVKEIGDRLDGKPHQSLEVENTTTRYVINARAEKPTREEWARQHAPSEPKTIQ